MTTTMTRATGATGNTAENGTETAATAPAADTATHPAPGQIGGAVWPALVAHPGATVTELTDAAGVSKPAVRRALNDLEAAGYATRTPGGRDGGKRIADTWHATPAPGPDTDAAGDGPVTADEPPSPQRPDEDTATTPDTGPDGGTDETASEGDEPRAIDEAALAEATETLTALAAMVADAERALQAGDRTAALTAAEMIYGSSGKARRVIKTAVNGRPRSASGKARSQPGELRAKVAAHLTAYPATQFTPHEVAKAIGHSAGAVANALDKLVEDGTAELTCERPRRFTTGDAPSVP